MSVTPAKGSRKSAKPRAPSRKDAADRGASGQKKHLVIVESPAKARTINQYLGREYVVKASMGHVRDLPPREFGIDIENGFKPKYQTIRGKAKVLQELKKYAQQCDKVFLAPDLDREGEAIAWHLVESLNIPKERAFRVVFNEITKKAITSAFETPGHISQEKVDAQQTRRFLDRIVGYQLSPLLWRKIAKGLSAGRVQSVAVRLIVDREREIEAFVSREYWKIQALFAKTAPLPAGAPPTFPDGTPGHHVKMELKRYGAEGAYEFAGREQAEGCIQAVKARRWQVGKVETKSKTERPKPPFITSELQQAASIELRFSAKKTMMIAQQLYEGVKIEGGESVGLITYMRTDSYHLADSAVEEAREFVRREFGDAYVPAKPAAYRAKAGAQEAHEAIRPTSALRTPRSLDAYLDHDQHRLYALIWKRFVACQMTAARYLITHVEVESGDCAFRAHGKQLEFPGHAAVSGVHIRKDEQMLPPLVEGEAMDMLDLTPSEHHTQPPARFTEASLVRALEKQGIGRPSTYATIMSTIVDRGYVREQERKFFATELGCLVTDQLTRHFPDIVDARFTAGLESKLDDIENGRENWQQVLRGFHGDFAANLKRAEGEMERVKGREAENVDPCPECGKPLLERWGKYGKFLGCSGYPDCSYKQNVAGDGSGPQPTEYRCEKCDSPMLLRQSRRGVAFLACSAYPKCQNAKSVDKEGKPIEPEYSEHCCDKCGRPYQIRTGKRGRKFLGCSGYPECQSVKYLDRDGNMVEPESVDEKCDLCGAEMMVRRGRRGRFLACRSPKCKGTKPYSSSADEPKATGKLCDKCGRAMVVREGSRGSFLACTGYPKCKNARPMEDLATLPDAPQAAELSSDRIAEPRS